MLPLENPPNQSTKLSWVIHFWLLIFVFQMFACSTMAGILNMGHTASNNH